MSETFRTEDETTRPTNLETPPSQEGSESQKDYQEKQTILDILGKVEGTTFSPDAKAYIDVVDTSGNLIGTAHGMFNTIEEAAEVYHKLHAQLRESLPESRGQYKYFTRLNNKQTHYAVLQSDI